MCELTIPNTVNHIYSVSCRPAGLLQQLCKIHVLQRCFTRIKEADVSYLVVPGPKEAFDSPLLVYYGLVDTAYTLSENFPILAYLGRLIRYSISCIQLLHFATEDHVEMEFKRLEKIYFRFSVAKLMVHFIRKHQMNSYGVCMATHCSSQRE